MSRRKLFLSGLVAVLIALLAGISLSLQRARSVSVPPTGSGAEAVAGLFASSLDDLEGRQRSFSNWQGKTLVVNFWASWCPPCREEMPAFSRLQERYAKQGVQFVGIALDTADSVRAFAAASPVSYPLLLGGGDGAELARRFGNTGLGLPYTVVISPAGELRLRHLGPLSEDELALAVQQTLAR
ncbi:MAG: TlpA disulfide reductase family protein [Candidatus Accumulibacter sp. UW25]|jgi:thiol-disulfide isomerase/thioredoxin